MKRITQFSLLLALTVTVTGTASAQFNPTARDQQMLELVNRFRLDPQAELALLTNSADPDVQLALSLFDVDLTLLAQQWMSLAPVQPLAWNESLYNAAVAHSQAMLDGDMQSHQLPGESDLGDRVEAAGYDFSTVGENIFAFAENVFHAHAAWVIDWGNTPTGIQDPPGHRINLMDSNNREFGFGLIEGTGTGMGNPHVGPVILTQDLGSRQNFGSPWLLGVVFDDVDADGFYSEGEGLGGVNVSIDGSGGNFDTTTMSAGGYQVQVPAGTYDVTFSGGGLASAVVRTATVASVNVKLDLELSAIPPPPSADLALTKTDSPDPVFIGNNVTYSLVVTNRGPDTATGVSIADVLPANTTFVSASPGCMHAGGVVTCNLGSVPNGVSTSAFIVVTTTATGTITNTAIVTRVEDDPVAGNNTALAVTTVNPPPPAASCSLTPQLATNFVGSLHAVICSVASNGVPAADVTVDFEVISGPNAGDTGSDVSDGNGDATFQYAGDGGVGTDIIQATGIVNGSMFTCTATKVWAPVTIGCSLLPATDTNQIGMAHVVTATITTNGNPATGVTVHLDVTAGPNAGFTGSTATDAAGHAAFQYLSDGAPGTDTLRATGSVFGISFSCEATSLWVTGPCPDLSGTLSNVKAKCKVKDEIATCKLSGSLVVPNTGDAPAGESIVRYYLSNNNILDGGDLKIFEGPVKAIALGKSGKGKLKTTLSNNSPTGRYLIAVLDAGGALTECNENNNIAVVGPIP